MITSHKYKYESDLITDLEVLNVLLSAPVWLVLLDLRSIRKADVISVV